ncbi:MAG: hypothetical protein LAN62_10860, partial [Acidobacteriia bacterium]|nr:hypothetical protein [Terriglobia bacterium]
MAYAQGCAMCYTSAAAAKKAGIEALRSGILILLVPPLMIFAGIIWLTYRSRNSFNGHGAEPQEDWREEPPPFAPGPPGGFEEEPVLAGAGSCIFHNAARRAVTWMFAPVSNSQFRTFFKQKRTFEGDEGKQSAVVKHGFSCADEDISVR